MVDRVKMPRIERAKQFAPFDALKGLQEAIKMKEYEHDKISQNEMSEDSVKEISQTLLNLKNGDVVCVKFFQDGHIYDLTAKAKIDVLNQKLIVGNFEILFDEINSIKIKE